MPAPRTTVRRPRLRVTVTDARGRPVASGGLARWLAEAAPAAARGTLSVALVTDTAMRRLNRRFRGVDRPTDVLAFPAAGGAAPRTPGTRPRRGPEATLRARGARAGRALAPHAGTFAPRSLGDIAIATGAARRQARQFGHSVRAEIRILALHGLLHLLGYDHDADAGEMARREERLRRRAGLPAGLLARRPRPVSAR
jgi:probable rRNA maturation factor